MFYYIVLSSISDFVNELVCYRVNLTKYCWNYFEELFRY